MSGDSVPTGYLAVGKVSAPHGLRGELKVELHTDFPDRFAPERVVFVGVDRVRTRILSSRPHKGGMLLRLDRVEDREAAESLRGQWLLIPEEESMALDDDTFWVHDIIGLSVRTESGRDLGVVEDVLFTGANEVYVVETPADVNRGRQLLLPALRDVIRNVDLDGRILTVQLPPGLLEEEL